MANMALSASSQISVIQSFPDPAEFLPPTLKSQEHSVTIPSLICLHFAAQRTKQKKASASPQAELVTRASPACFGLG